MKKRSDGRYRAKVNVGRDSNNNPIYKYVYSSDKKELDRMVAQLKIDSDRGMDVLHYDTTFDAVAEEFLRGEEKCQSQHIYGVKKANIKVFINYIGNLPIKDIKPYQIESVLQILANKNPFTGKPSSKKTLKEYCNACSQVFKFAIKNRIADYNPCTYAVIPDTATPTKTRRALEENERDAIIQCTGRAKLPAMLMMFAGLRRGEAAALTWNDIDFKKNQITIDKAYDYVNHRLKSTKTESGIRTVPMPGILADYLKTIKKESIYVISMQGKRVTEAGWEKLLYELQIEMETIIGDSELVQIKVGNKYQTMITFKPFGWHDLRHTYASLLAYSGVVPAEAKELLGHKDITTTMNIYTHINWTVKQASVSKLDEFVKNVGGQMGVR